MNTLLAVDSDSSSEILSQLTSHQGATLMRVIQDVFPQNAMSETQCAIAFEAYSYRSARLIKSGLAGLDNQAQRAGYADYRSVMWEVDRVELLLRIESTPFFKTLIGALSSVPGD